MLDPDERTPAPLATSSGMTPRMKLKAVMSTARNRSLVAAMAIGIGIDDTMYFMITYRNALRSGLDTAAAIKKNDVPYVVHLSSVGADLDEGSGPVLGLHDNEMILAEAAESFSGVFLIRLGLPFFRISVNVGGGEQGKPPLLVHHERKILVWNERSSIIETGQNGIITHFRKRHVYPQEPLFIAGAVSIIPVTIGLDHSLLQIDNRSPWR